MLIGFLLYFLPILANKVVHILITSNQPDGFVIMDQETNSERKFQNLKEIIEFYREVLQRPFISNVPIQG